MQVLRLTPTNYYTPTEKRTPHVNVSPSYTQQNDTITFGHSRREFLRLSSASILSFLVPVKAQDCPTFEYIDDYYRGVMGSDSGTVCATVLNDAKDERSCQARSCGLTIRIPHKEYKGQNPNYVKVVRLNYGKARTEGKKANEWPVNHIVINSVTWSPPLRDEEDEEETRVSYSKD